MVDNRLTRLAPTGTLSFTTSSTAPARSQQRFAERVGGENPDLPACGQAARVLEVHPDFRAIFTSNPRVCRVHKTQDALMDRLSLNLVTSTARRRSRSPSPNRCARGTPRSSWTSSASCGHRRQQSPADHSRTIVIGQDLVHRRAHARLDDPVFQWSPRVLSIETAKVTRDGSR